MARVLAWFSCGAASAVALKLAIEKYGDAVIPLYCDTRSEHSDNVRFMTDIENWLGVKVKTISSNKYRDINDVFESTKFLRSKNGARCTVEMKKVPRYQFQQPDDKHIFGYTREEGSRIAQIMAENWDLKIECPLYSAKLKKQDCIRIIQEAGIEIPTMYRLGFNNNNCPGCVKTDSPNYWLLVKEHFPEVFKRRSEQERALNFALCRYRKKPVFLDELTEKHRTKSMPKIGCDFVCSSNTQEGEG